MTELEKAEQEFEKAKQWLLTVEKGYLLKEEQLRKAQGDYMTASTKLAAVKNKK